MSESNSKIESQFIFYGDQKTSFSKLKEEESRNDIKDDEMIEKNDTKNDEDFMFVNDNKIENTTVDILTTMAEKLNKDKLVNEKDNQLNQSNETVLQNQHLVSSLNSLINNNSQAIFSQKIAELLIYSALGQQNSQSNSQFNNQQQMDNENVNKANEQIKSSVFEENNLVANSLLNKSPLLTSLNKTSNNFNKQAALTSAVAAAISMLETQFNNHIQTNTELNATNLTDRDSKNDQQNIFSGVFQSLLFNNPSSKTNENINKTTQNSSIVNSNWRPIRHTNSSLINSSKQSGPASWIDRSKLGSVTAQNLHRRHIINRFDYTEYYKEFSSSLKCGSKTCNDLNYREHYHCLDCQQRAFVKKEELIRHFKWHRKREDSLVNGFLRYSACDDCSTEFPRCIHNRKHTHYHCLKKGCDKCYISTSDVQMHASYHRKDAMMLEEGFQRFRGTEDCECSKCQFSGQKTTHFHCMRSNCNYIFKNKAEMEKHKTAHFKDDQLSKDGFKKIHKNDCRIIDCNLLNKSLHYHCIKTGCNESFETTGQLYAHRKKHERREVELAYLKIVFAQSNCNMFNNLGNLPNFDTTVFEDTEQYPGFVYTPEIDTLIQQLPLSKVCSIPFESMVKECKGAICLKYLKKTNVNDQVYYKCIKCEENLNSLNAEEHAKNHILIDECTKMMFEFCEDGKNGLYDCNLTDLGKHYHCKMFNCNFVVHINGSELKRLQHFKDHEDEQKNSFLDDFVHSTSSINSTNELNCTNSFNQSNFMEQDVLNNSPITTNSNCFYQNKNKKDNEETNSNNSPNLQSTKDDIEQFGLNLTTPINSQYENFSSLNTSKDCTNSSNDFYNSFANNLRANNLQQLQNSFLDNSNSLLKRKRGRPPKKLDEEEIFCPKKNHLSSIVNPNLINQEIDNKNSMNDFNVSMLLNNLFMQQNNFNEKNENLLRNMASMNEKKTQTNETLNFNNLINQNTVNFSMLNYLTSLNYQNSTNSSPNLFNQLTNQSMNDVLQQNQTYRNLIKQNRKQIKLNESNNKEFLQQFNDSNKKDFTQQLNDSNRKEFLQQLLDKNCNNQHCKFFNLKHFHCIDPNCSFTGQDENSFLIHLKDSHEDFLP